ncbi:unnamed protein product [Heligmosomoides polygyrus]|uniref:Uncharacterized protein n=1 Tax=Heligmosomoides polygyrus TaxID=6339 RepID=A0A3P8FI51_HELPZ|nr:unnamed protein product [Heligmosomoides polygyrus]
MEEADKDKDKDKQKDAEVRDAPRAVGMRDFSDRVVVDIKVVNDQGRAQEVLRNLWSYRRLETLHLQGCALTDEDIAGVEHVNRRVKYLCLRGNDLRNPWQAFSTKFPELFVLDYKGNRTKASVKAGKMKEQKTTEQEKSNLKKDDEVRTRTMIRRRQWILMMKSLVHNECGLVAWSEMPL